MNAKSKAVEKERSPLSGVPWKRTLVVFLLALVVRLVYLFESSDSPFFSTPLSDAATYHLLAKGLMEGGELGWKFFFQGVFYPFFLFLVYSVFGPSVIAVKVTQAFLGAATAALTERLGSRIAGRFAGWTSGCITALYGPMVFFDGELLATSWAMFFAAALLLGFVVVVEESKTLWFFLLGIIGGMSVLNRPDFLPFFVFSSAWFFFVLRNKGRKILTRGTLGILFGFLLVTLPVTCINKQVTNHFSFLPSSGGLNLYIGNNSKPCDTLTIRPGLRWQALVNEPVKHGYVYGADKETYYTKKFFEYVREDPLGYVRGLALKALRFINGREIPRNDDIYLYRKWSGFMEISVWKIARFGFPFSLLFAFAVMGIFFKSSLKLPMPVYLFISLYPLSIIAVFVTARYRMPMIPIMAVLTSIGAKTLLDSIRCRAYMRLIKMSVTASAALVLSVVPPVFCEEKIDLEAEMYFEGATFSTLENNLDRSIAFYQQATRLNPRYYEAFEMLGLSLNEKGRLNESAEAFRTAVSLMPDAFDSLFYLSKTLGRLGRFQEAETYLNRALLLQPSNGYIHSYLGICLAAQGKTAAAYEHLQEAVRLMPTDRLAKQNLMRVEKQLSFGGTL